MNIPKKDLVERLLYVTLVLVFIGVLIAVFVVINFGQKLTLQLEQLKAISQTQAQTIQEIRDGVLEVKRDNQSNTLYLKCLIEQPNELCPQGLALTALLPPSPSPVPAEVATPAPIPSPVPTVTPAPPVTPAPCRVNLLGLCLVR